MKPETEFTCQITHHDFETADVVVREGSDGIVAEITVQDRHDGFSVANSRISLTEHELADITEIVARFRKANETLKSGK